MDEGTQTRARRLPPKVGRGIAIGLAVLFFLQAFLASRNESLTWDEPSFISAGYSYLTRGDFSLNPSHPPLLQDLMALPLCFVDLKVPPPDHPSLSAVNPVVQFGHELVFESGNDHEQIATLARFPIHLLGALLVLAIYFWGRKLYGDVPALFAAALVAFSPNLIAHAKLATEDLGCSVFMFLAMWSFWNAWQKQSMQSFALWGLLTGLALLAKYTALLLMPVYALLYVVLIARSESKVRWKQLAQGTGLAAAITLFLIGAAYNFSFDYSLYWSGMSKIYSDMTSGTYYWYLFGSVTHEPVRYYALATMLLKLPVSTLLLIPFALGVAIRDRARQETALFVLVPAFAIVAATLFDKANLGFRRMLPACPFLFLFMAQVLAGRPAMLRKVAAGVLLSWTVIQSLAVYPHHLSYINTVAGGPANGPYLLDDSNVDWGQDLPALAAWQREHPEARKLRLYYFGTAKPEAYGVEFERFERSEIDAPKPGFYAVSAHILAAFRKRRWQRTGRGTDWLTRYRPVARAGYSIWIYDLRADAGPDVR